MRSAYIQVNKIREVPQHPHIVVTHTDKPELYVWNLETQPNRASDQVSSAHRCCAVRKPPCEHMVHVSCSLHQGMEHVSGYLGSE